MNRTTMLGLAGLCFAGALCAQPPPAVPQPPCAPGATVVCGQQGPEDLVAIGTAWVAASAMAAPGGVRVVRTRDRSPFTVYPAANAGTRHDRQTYPSCPGPPDPQNFTTHGLYAEPGAGPTYKLFVVAHGARESIEIFELDTSGETPVATWLGCAVAPDPIGLNSVRGLPDGGFIATNFLPRGTSPEATQRMREGERNGELWEWHTTSGWQKVPGSEAAGANGLELSADGSTLYVAAWGTQSFFRLSRGATTPKRDEVPLGFRVDNIHWARDGSLFAVGQAQQGWKVVKIDPSTLAVRDVLVQADTPEFNAGTALVEVGDALWVGSFRGNRIVIVPGLTEQQRLRAQSPGGGLTPGVALPSWPEPATRLAGSAPVTDAMLASPSPNDWLSWRRTRDGLGFSPLSSIDKRNVGTLQLAWSLSLPAGPNTATPLVHDGVIYVHSFGDHVQALDGATGDELWHYARELPSTFRPTVKRNMALYGGKLYVGTSDVHVVALDAKTGAVVWDTAIAEASSGLGLTGGPLVARGKVMQGVNGQAPGGAYIVALDAESGREVWRFHSIARPGEPGGDSWNGLPLDKRTGGSVWTAGSYDAERNVALFGPAPTYDTGPLRDSIAKPGITNDALYTNTTIALDPDTGKLVWHFQHVPNDQWDFDWAFERQIVTLPIDGRSRRVVLTAGKEAIYDALDLDGGGRYLFSIDLGLQNFITAIDPRTGAKTIDPKLVPSREEAIVVCPHAGGAKSWVPGAINPSTRVLFVPLVESCMDLTPVPLEQRGSLSTGVRWTIRPRLDGDGRYGRIQAIDLTTRETLWTERQRAPQTTGVLATAGGLVFAGALDRVLTAYDDATGKALWQAKLNDVPSSAPISYSVDGKQYVAMTVGHGSPQALTFPMLTPEIDLPIVRSATIWVFALPRR